mmetsp:Transcript_34400/g.106821  ORF Transcript_34400/g.106821 Transcript_34400/m.106821 type:complete len:257 (+) Transcript_34400:868-1638(+)
MQLVIAHLEDREAMVPIVEGVVVIVQLGPGRPVPQAVWRNVAALDATGVLHHELHTPEEVVPRVVQGIKTERLHLAQPRGPRHVQEGQLLRERVHLGALGNRCVVVLPGLDRGDERLSLAVALGRGLLQRLPALAVEGVTDKAYDILQGVHVCIGEEGTEAANLVYRRYSSDSAALVEHVADGQAEHRPDDAVHNLLQRGVLEGRLVWRWAEPAERPLANGVADHSGAPGDDGGHLIEPNAIDFLPDVVREADEAL